MEGFADGGVVGKVHGVKITGHGIKLPFNGLGWTEGRVVELTQDKFIWKWLVSGVGREAKFIHEGMMGTAELVGCNPIGNSDYEDKHHSFIVAKAHEASTKSS